MSRDDLILAIRHRLDRGDPPIAILRDLETGHGAKHRFASGTYHLSLDGVKATCTAGGFNLIQAWLRKAVRQ